ncbi:MAG: serine protease, partial [Candidatus Methanoplasma sp.]|nr:serine protease [Candidatus Methanoplasma sp.]
VLSVSCYAAFADNGIKEEPFHLKRSLGSTLELSCGNDEDIVVYGSGFLVEGDGPNVVSNAHVVTFSEDGIYRAYEVIEARFYDSDRAYNLYVVSFDVRKDIAVMGFYDDVIEREPFMLETRMADYGEEVMGIGNARGYGLSLSEGIVSIPLINIVRNGTERPSVVTTAPINEGDSGGPLINTDGKVIGMMSFRLKDESNNSIYGMSYAIPSAEISKYISSVGSSDKPLEDA